MLSRSHHLITLPHSFLQDALFFLFPNLESILRSMMSTLPPWVIILVGLGISKLVLDICALIKLIILRRRQPISAGNHDSSLFDDPLREGLYFLD